MKTIKLTLPLILFLFTGNMALSTSYTWVGGSSTWNDPSNWSPSSGVPGPGDNATIGATANDPVYNPPGSAQLYNLVMDGGTLDLNGNTLTLTNAGTFNAGTVTNGTIYASSITSLLFLGTTMDCKVKGSSGGLRMNSTLFTDSVVIEKNGSANNSSDGQNEFMDYVSLTNSGTGYLRLGTLYPDTFHDKVNLTSIDNYISVAHNSDGTYFEDDVKVKCKTGAGINFGLESTTKMTMANGHVIDVDTFSTGVMRVWGMHHLGGIEQNIELTGDAQLYIYYGEYDSTLTAISPRLFVRENTFNSFATFRKTGSTADAMNGGNIHYGPVSFQNNGSDDMRLQTVLPDTFYDNVTFKANSHRIRVAYNDISDVSLFADTVTFNSTSNVINDIAKAGDVKFEAPVLLGCSDGDIRFGVDGGETTLAENGKLQIESTIGYSTGDLRLYHITQTGSAPQLLTITGDAQLFIDDCLFNGEVSFKAPYLTSESSTYNDETTLEQTGSGNAFSNGNNVFQSKTIITNSGSGNLYMGNTTGDDYNGNVTFNQISTGRVYPGYNSTSYYAQDIVINGTHDDMLFGQGSSVSRNVLDGSGIQYLDGNTNEMVFKKLIIDKPSGHVNIDVIVYVTDSLIFENGVFRNPSHQHGVALTDNAIWVGASDDSYVECIAAKEGNDAYTFPVGSNGHLRPISMSAPSATDDVFYAEHLNYSSDIDNSHASKDGSLNRISTNEFWVLERYVGTSEVSVTLSWGDLSCGFDTLANLRVTAWNGSQWKDKGNGGTTGDTTSGAIVTSSASDIYGPFALATIDTFRCIPCSAYAGEDTIIMSTETLQLGEASTSGIDYLWSPSSGLSSSTISNPIASPTTSTIYTLETTNSHECTAIDEVSVEVVPVPIMPICVSPPQ